MYTGRIIFKLCPDHFWIWLRRYMIYKMKDFEHYAPGDWSTVKEIKIPSTMHCDVDCGSSVGFPSGLSFADDLILHSVKTIQKNKKRE